MDHRRSVAVTKPEYLHEFSVHDFNLQAWSDGGHRREGYSAAGFILKAWSDGVPFVILAVAEFISDPQIDSMRAEIRGLELAMTAINSLISKRSIFEFCKEIDCPLHDFDVFWGSTL